MNLAKFLLLALFASTAALSGCTALPRSGPDDAAVEKQASVRVTTEGRKVGIDYILVDINKTILPSFQQPAATSIRDSFGGGRGGPPDVPLGIGDTVQVSIFEAQAGGLFIPTEAGSRPGNYITLPSQSIDRSGTLTVPYAGRIVAAGRPKEQVEREIEEKLSNRAIEPQVVITTVNGRSSEVAVLGDVAKAGKFEVTSAGERVLDLISEAGGISAPSIETYVTLQRRGKSGTISYDKLQTTPAENIYASPGDTILVNRERRTYTVYGAAGLNGRFDFEETKLTLGEALGKAGGLLDARADPGQVFLYRKVSRKTMQGLSIDTSRFVGEDIPVIFRANMRDPGSFFAVQQFAMQDKDIIYISNADSVEVVKFLNVLNSVTSNTSGAVTDAVDGRDAAKRIFRN
ncbi:polysaccharide biosynthesis/export family protein [Agrobacterium cavarae]|jgi:polysaccharide export outer membrane protein|uniref:Polysaccharide export protein n=1 Tax=Agrobacterium cavarae TaxID=2528239 RepID=A0ABY1YAH3_9HYPH|nr:polysaccharide export protein [Agrobacterium tumefaciens]TBN15047.1 polysaccharide export protein [Agrobacterium cavarae]